MEMYRGNGCRKRRASWLFCCCECRLWCHKKTFLRRRFTVPGKGKGEGKRSYTSLEANTQILPIIKTPQTSNVSFPFFFSFLIALLSILVLQLFKTNKTSCTFFFIFQARGQLLDGLPTKACLPLRNHDMSWFKLLPRKVSWEAWGSLSALNWLYPECGCAYSAEMEAESSESRIMQGDLRIRSRRCARKGSCICCGIPMKN